MSKIKGYISTRQVYIDEIELTPDRSRKICDHSPDGFNWGYGGSGPAQLALALHVYFFSKEAMKHGPNGYQQLKWDIVSKLPQGKNFVIDSDIITSWFGKDRS